MVPDGGGVGDEAGEDKDEEEEEVDSKSLYLYVGRYDATAPSAHSTSWKILQFSPAPGVLFVMTAFGQDIFRVLGV
jgi:hypothetical protein